MNHDIEWLFDVQKKFDPFLYNNFKTFKLED